MRRIVFYVFMTIFIGITSCSDTKKIEQLETLYRDSMSLLRKDMAELKKQNEALKYPADQRLSQIHMLVNSDELDKAISKIKELKELYPISNEAKECDELTEIINDKKIAAEKEKARIQALGFKAVSVKSKATIGENEVGISAVSTGSKFIHDTYSTYSGSQWFFNTADKGNIFMLASMSVTSTSKDPNIPTLAVYTINGDKMILVDDFKIEFARWDDYGSYLGNEPDLKNDFAKVNTVYFKLGCEVSADLAKKPYAIVLRRANTQIRNYDRFRNPPIWYSGNSGYKQTLGVSDFEKEYVLIKLANL